MVTPCLLRKLIFIIFAFTATPSFASTEAEEIQGLVIDRTITVSGHDFYRAFAALWLVASRNGGVNLIITEKPSARWGNLVTIRGQNQILYKASIRQGRQADKNTIKNAVSVVSRKILRLMLTQNNSQDMATTGF